MKKLLIGLSALGIALLSNAAPVVQAAPQVDARISARTPAFEPARCMFPLPPGASEGPRLECGYLSVPELHSNPSGPKIKLAVAILKSDSASPKDDPLVMLQGGPGGSTIDTYAGLLLLINPFRNDRDVILFDQRGTLYSKPALTCKELRELSDRTLDQKLSLEESSKLAADAMAACRDRLKAEGVNLAAFNSLENAADVEALRVALSYEKINLYGVSYGTLLALHVMRDFPGGLRSVILDAVVPTNLNYVTQTPQSADRVFTEFFAACAKDATCNKNYPNLEKTFFDLVQQLNDKPARVQLTNGETSAQSNAQIDGNGLINLLFQALYASDLHPILPQAITDAAAGNTELLAGIQSLFAFDDSMSIGMHYSVVCAEDADFKESDIDTSDIRLELRELQKQGALDYLKICPAWGVKDLGASIDAPVTSDIPTLVLNGQLDPITPPAFGQTAAEGLRNSYAFTFPGGGHGQLNFTNTCATSMVREFLDDPTLQPDDTCVATNKPAFSPPTEIASVSFMNVVNNILTGKRSLAPALLMGGGLSFLLTLLLVWPIAWLVRLLRNKPGDHRPGTRISRWLVVLLLVAVVAFVIWLGVILFGMFQNQQLILTTFGIPAQQVGVFVLPLLVLGLTVLMGLCLLVAW
ncbi:MAG: alpha/beta fold hydrolase, partial [Anaerolineae bacterium]|nr:alpha/beta fold hydrolase [Anaerolineae bacterium]